MVEIAKKYKIICNSVAYNWIENKFRDLDRKAIVERVWLGDQKRFSDTAIIITCQQRIIQRLKKKFGGGIISVEEIE